MGAARATCVIALVCGVVSLSGDRRAEAWGGWQGRATTWYVAEGGAGSADGSSWSNAMATIQGALDAAQPGDRIRVGAGVFREDLRTVRDGRASRPIRIEGTQGWGKQTVLKGAPGGSGFIFRIEHDHHRLSHITIDGLDGQADDRSAYHKKLIYVEGTQPERGPVGVVVHHTTLRNALDECLRLRYFVRHARIHHNTITDCGIEDQRFGGGKTNGEGIYVGTAQSQWSDNLTDGPDVTEDILIYDNVIGGINSECINTKRGSRDVTIVGNRCSGSFDVNSGAFDIRSDDNLVAGNFITASLGAGIRLGNSSGGEVYGSGNVVYGNTIDNSLFGIKMIAGSQRLVCENAIDAVTKITTGPFRNEIRPEEPCFW